MFAPYIYYMNCLEAYKKWLSREAKRRHLVIIAVTLVGLALALASHETGSAFLKAVTFIYVCLFVLLSPFVLVTMGYGFGKSRQ